MLGERENQWLLVRAMPILSFALFTVTLPNQYRLLKLLEDQ